MAADQGIQSQPHPVAVPCLPGTVDHRIQHIDVPLEEACHVSHVHFAAVYRVIDRLIPALPAARQETVEIGCDLRYVAPERVYLSGAVVIFLPGCVLLLPVPVPGLEYLVLVVHLLFYQVNEELHALVRPGGGGSYDRVHAVEHELKVGYHLGQGRVVYGEIPVP